MPADLLRHPCLHYRFAHNGKLETWPLQQATEESGLPLPTSMTCNNIETRVCFALQGLGIAFLPEFAIGELLADGRLVPVLPGQARRTGTFHILWPASRYPSPKVRALVDFLGAHMFPHGRE